MRPNQSTTQNLLLRGLSEPDFNGIAPALRHVMLPLKEVIEQSGEIIQRIVFPDDGMISIVASANSADELEVGIIGFDGMTGLAVLHGANSTPERTFVQIEGAGWDVSSDEFRIFIAERPDAKALFLRYSRAHAVQVMQSALAYGRFSLEERLARWLLMCHDRLRNDEIALTHEFLSLMLGTRRAGVTTAMHILEGFGMIKSRRGVVIVRSREQLIDTAGGSYGVAEAEYGRLIGVRLGPGAPDDQRSIETVLRS